MDDSFAALAMPDGLGGAIGLHYRSDQAELRIGSPALSPSPGWSRTFGRHLVLPGSEGPRYYDAGDTIGIDFGENDPMVLVSDVGERHILPGVLGAYKDPATAFRVDKQPNGTWVASYPNGNSDVFLADGTLSEMRDPSLPMCLRQFARPRLV